MKIYINKSIKNKSIKKNKDITYIYKIYLMYQTYLTNIGK